MIDMREGELTFSFADDWSVNHYDRWSYYCNQFQHVCGGAKGVDLIALEPADRVAWLVEVKDFVQGPRNSRDKGPLEDEVAAKVRDTLAGLFATRVNGGDSAPDEQAFARRALGVGRLRVVLHLEQPRHPRPRQPAYNLADLQLSLKQRLKAIDAKPQVVSADSDNRVPWTVRRAPQPAPAGG